MFWRWKWGCDWTVYCRCWSIQDTEIIPPGHCHVILLTGLAPHPSLLTHTIQKACVNLHRLKTKTPKETYARSLIWQSQRKKTRTIVRNQHLAKIQGAQFSMHTNIAHWESSINFDDHYTTCRGLITLTSWLPFGSWKYLNQWRCKWNSVAAMCLIHIYNYKISYS